MISINISKKYKYKYIILRNRRQISEFNTKKQASLALQQTSESYTRLNYEQDIYNFTFTFLQGGSVLSLYTRNCIADEEFRDWFEIRRILNE